jgi:hypothetical protein
MCQDESRHVIGRVVAPPAFPERIGPRTSTRSEHIPAENPGANILETARSEIIVDPRCATFGAKQGPLERACWNQPLVQTCAAHAKGIRDVLVRTSAESIKRNGKAINSDVCQLDVVLSSDWVGTAA